MQLAARQIALRVSVHAIHVEALPSIPDTSVSPELLGIVPNSH